MSWSGEIAAKLGENVGLLGLIGVFGKIGLTNQHFGQNSFILPRFTIDSCFLYLYYPSHLAKLSRFTIFAVHG
jgi:hypothetical protein